MVLIHPYFVPNRSAVNKFISRIAQYTTCISGLNTEFYIFFNQEAVHVVKFFCRGKKSGTGGALYARVNFFYGIVTSVIYRVGV